MKSPFGIFPIFRGELSSFQGMYTISLNKNYPTPFVDIILPKRNDGETTKLVASLSGGQWCIGIGTSDTWSCLPRVTWPGGSRGDTQSQGVTWVTGKTRKPRKPQTLRWMLLPVQKGPKHLPRISFEGKIWLLGASGVVLEMNQDG